GIGGLGGAHRDTSLFGSNPRYAGPRLSRGGRTTASMDTSAAKGVPETAGGIALRVLGGEFEMVHRLRFQTVRPGSFSRTAQSVPPAVTNSVLKSSPPKAQLVHSSRGIRII